MRGRRLPLICLMMLALAALACNLGSPTRVNPTLIATRITANQGTLQATNPAAAAQTQSPDGCTERADWPTMIITEGDTLSGIAARTGTSIEALQEANCLDDRDAIFAGQTLRVPVLPSGSAAPAPSSGAAFPPATCSESWFFVFSRGAVDTSCPGSVTISNAVGQNFQHGRVYRYEPISLGGSRGTVYVIYNDGTWTSYPDTWDPSQPADDPSIVPPETWYKAYGSIGKVWRDQIDRLGWAYQPEASFTGRVQEPVTPGGYFYIAHGLRNLVLRMYNGGGAANRWEVVGNE